MGSLEPTFVTPSLVGPVGSLLDREAARELRDLMSKVEDPGRRAHCLAALARTCAASWREEAIRSAMARVCDAGRRASAVAGPRHADRDRGSAADRRCAHGDGERPPRPRPQGRNQSPPQGGGPRTSTSAPTSPTASCRHRGLLCPTRKQDAFHSIRMPEMARLMISRWISLVPSKMVKILASRAQRSTG